MNRKVVKGARNELSLVKANVEAHVESSGDCVTLGVAQYSANKLMNLLIFIELKEAAQVATSICLAITNAVDHTRVFEDKQWAVLIDALVGLDASLENCVDTPDSFPQSLESPRRAMAALATHETESNQQIPDGSVLEIENSAQGLVDAQENELAGIDPEILEIFNEEAIEELEVIQAQYALWKEDPSNGEAIDTVRRSFHTLKGSGNVVGAVTLGNFSASGETLFARVTMGELTHSSSLLVLLDDFVATMVCMIDSVFSGNPLPREAMAVIETRAVNFPRDEKVSSSAIEREPGSTPIDSSATDQPDLEGAEELGRMDAGLYEIFVPEARVYIDTISAFIEQANELPQTVTKELVTAVHTLHSCSHLAGADAMARLSGVMERYCKSLVRLSRVCDADTLQLLGSYADTMRDSVNAINTPDVSTPEWQPLFEEIDWTDQALVGSVATHVLAPGATEATNSFYADVSAFMANAVKQMADLHDCFAIWKASPGCSTEKENFATKLTEFGSGASTDQFAGMVCLLSLMKSLIQTSANFDDDAVDLIDGGLGNLEELLDNLYVGQKLPDLTDITEKLQTELDLRTGQEVKEGTESETANSQRDLNDALNSSEETEDLSFLEFDSTDEVEAPDPELLPLFLEEAGELIHQLEEAHTTWLTDTTSSEAMDAQLRHLHTLKGNALLANLYSLGRLSHYLESLFEILVSGQQASSTNLLTLIRAGFDGVHGSVDSLNESRPLPALQSLTSAVKAAVQGQSWDEYIDLLGADHHVIDEVPVDEAFTPELLAQPQVVEQSVVGQPIAEQSIADQQLVRQKTPPLLQAEREAGDEHQRIRVLSSVLDKLVNDAGEISITQTHLDIQNTKDKYNLLELKTTIGRLQRQLGTLNVETEAQIISRHQGENSEHNDTAFDPLEMDRYSTLQQITRSIAETVSDLSEIEGILDKSSDDTDSLMLKVSLAARDVRNGLLKTLMVPMKQQEARFRRVVRTAAQGEGKEIEFEMLGFGGDIERNLIEKIVAPIEHLLRNAVVHGIESPDARGSDKPRQGKIQLSFVRDFSNMEIIISDDGAGIDNELIRASAIKRGLLESDAEISEEDLRQLILVPGFSTANKVSLLAGRGVGMDVVMDGIQQLGGSISIASERGKGSTFAIRLPAMQSLIDALMIEVAGEVYALPHGSVDSVIKVRAVDILPNYGKNNPTLEHEGKIYELSYLGSMLGLSAPPSASAVVGEVPVLLAQIGSRAVAVQVDYLVGTSKIQVVPIGNQFKNYPWFVDSTLLSSGKIALLLNVKALLHDSQAQQENEVLEPVAEKVPSIMIVDDSITLRKITSRIFEREGMSIVTAKDGVEAITMLQDYTPDVMLLDVEMPRMNGYELALQMKNHERLKNIPIIMITSRTGKKHVQRGMELGVKYYLGKPFHEPELLECVHTLLEDNSNE